MELLIIISAGIGAGIITGLVGGSAALVVTPMLVNLLGIPVYTAIMIALATDVFASSVSSYTYAKNGFIRIKDAFTLVLFAALASVLGSYLAQFINASILGTISTVITLLLGINFIRTAKVPPIKREDRKKNFFTEHPEFSKIFFGSIIGLICGIVGAGGGMMILLILIAVLHYELKEAIGTSVFIMTFTALTGALAHLTHITDIKQTLIIVVISGISSILGAFAAAKFMGNASQVMAKRVAGSFLIIIFFLSFIS